MIVLFTDFGVGSLYQGQMQAALLRASGRPLPVVELCSDAPRYNPRAAAYLLAALAPGLPRGAVIVGVVDPGVGSERRAVVLEADGRWYVGPDNGLFAIVARQAPEPRWREILWRPESLSDTFHGRDLFAPAAVCIHQGRPLALAAPDPGVMVGADWPVELAEVIYLDPYGNAMTALRGGTVSPAARIRVNGRVLAHGRTFSDLRPGTPFWYVNSSGLVELAVSRGNAAQALGLQVGTPIHIDNQMPAGRPAEPESQHGDSEL